MLLQLGLQIFLPVFLLSGLYRGKYSTRLEWSLNALAVAAILFFVCLTARWDFTSYYILFLLPPGLLVAAFVSLRRVGNAERTDARSRMAVYLPVSAMVVAFVALCGMVLSGYRAPDGTLDLASPLRGGTYYVGGGGNHRLINNHQASDAQKHALDIVRLNGFGNRGTPFTSADVESYAIYGDTVYSPCSGTVVKADDGLVDSRPPTTDTENLAGNHVVLACHGADVLLAHLMQGSVAVKVGDALAVGDILGRVGNSGYSTQPHLHIHAVKEAGGDHVLDGEPVPFKIEGRFLVRNSLVKGER